ncbi:CRISP-associated protein Cas1 [Desulfonatronum thiosulfatophilum]|uniref:CRISP-associated protein Cas1 n=1 Tax=Desulfonatronum thiosulfatophilum TaxID=617002 RepID=A0A1G6EV87_9BACT|nr:hypothetical protein [Desulfonatronum thiosulfatophilum]SDB61318.1 CRISP-associated protein Cas1 [Desulfonatronum thiosulfatophilum]
MKKLLNTLYVTTQGAYLSREGETVLVRVEKETRLQVPYAGRHCLLWAGLVQSVFAGSMR